MQYEVLFTSKTGNTEKLAKEIYQTIPGNTKEIRPIQDAIATISDIYFIGFWTNKGTCSMDILNYISMLHNKKIALFGTCGFAGQEQYFHSIKSRVSAFIPDDNQLLGFFMCQGKMPMQVRTRYEMLTEVTEKRELAKQMLSNFDEALLHPSNQDLKNVRLFTEEILNNIEKRNPLL